MPLVEIWDQVAIGVEHGSSSKPGVELRDLLAALPTEKLALRWSIMELWAVTHDDRTDVAAIGARAAESSTGLEITGGDLLDLSHRLSQVIDAIVVAYDGSPPARSDNDLRASSAIVIEAIDSTLWRVYAKDASVTDRLSHAFADVREVSPEVPIPASHAAGSR
jgi:hypothetical protein